MTIRKVLAITTIAAVGWLAVGQFAANARQPDSVPVDDSAVAEAAGLQIATIEPETGTPLVRDDLPDLIPVQNDVGELLGYARADEVFVEMFDPSKESVAFGIYGPDGTTLRGYEIPGEGFVEAKQPIETSRQAVVPPPLQGPILPVEG